MVKNIHYIGPKLTRLQKFVTWLYEKIVVEPVEKSATWIGEPDEMSPEEEAYLEKQVIRAWTGDDGTYRTDH